jgi:hypothetical protein
MQRTRAFENSRQAVPDRGVDSSAPRSTPLTLVAGAVAGDNLESVAATVADALACPVAIAIPALGDPVVCPPGSLGDEGTAAIAAHAVAVGEGREVRAPDPIVEAVAVRIGEQIVGIVAAAARTAGGAADANATGSDAPPERRAWLDAAAAAASVTALIGDAQATGTQGSSEGLLAEVAAGPPDDLPGWLARARRLGLELGAGAVAVSARRAPTVGNDHPAESRGDDRALLDELSHEPGAVIAALRAGRIVALAPASPRGTSEAAGELAARLRAEGMAVATSAPRKDPAALHEAVREAELLAELGSSPEAQRAGQDETYRLLIGVLLRDRAELEQLRNSTITPLADYDGRHDTELLATLRAFLTHDGSTTETAEAMQLHRHTVGYRLSRVHEVSGLSPYESDGRERLSLGIKAGHILAADRRLDQEIAPGP